MTRDRQQQVLVRTRCRCSSQMSVRLKPPLWKIPRHFFILFCFRDTIMLVSSDWPGSSCLRLLCAEVVSHVPPSLTSAFPIKSSVHLAYDTIPLLDSLSNWRSHWLFWLHKYCFLKVLNEVSLWLQSRLTLKILQWLHRRRPMKSRVKNASFYFV